MHTNRVLKLIKSDAMLCAALKFTMFKNLVCIAFETSGSFKLHVMKVIPHFQKRQHFAFHLNLLCLKN